MPRARDRRWAQGNLQHTKVIFARGLTWPSRVHLAIGIMSYLASPVWLALIAIGFALSLQAYFIRPEYFTDSFQLFPTWPHFDSERMIRLFGLTLVVLLLPKLLGLARALWMKDVRRGCGGPVRLVASFFAELIVSALLAPIMMAIHSRQVYEIVAGRDAGWSPQRRGDGELPWGDTWRFHRWHTAFGIVVAATAYVLSPAILAWLAPTLAGLFFAVPISRASGSTRVGALFRNAGLLVTPDETRPDPIFAVRDDLAAQLPALPKDGIRALATDAAVRGTHYRWTNSAPRLRGAPDAAYLTAGDKVMEARSVDEALAWLHVHERLHVAGHQGFAEQLAKLNGGDDPPPAAIQGLPAKSLDLPGDREKIRLTA